MKGYSKYIHSYFSIKKYSDDYYKLTFHKLPIKNSGFEKEKKVKNKKNKDDEKLYNNIIRAKNKVFEYSLCNEFDYFVTLTLDGKKYDRKNLDKYIKDLGQFIRDKRKKYNSNIQYILIPEKHKDGAWHMHGLIKGIPKKYLIINENGYLDYPEYKKRFGYISLDNVKNQIAVSKYITKYITKDIENNVTEKNKKLYYCSRGLKTSKKIIEGLLSPSTLEKIKFNYENEYIAIKDLTKDEYLKLIEDLRLIEDL